MGTFDEVGILYARTVFDPLMILDADGTPQPYLAQSVTPNSDYTVWTITMRPNLVFHNGAPCDAAAVAANFNAQKASAAHRAGPDHGRQRSSVTSPLVVTVTMKSPWVPVRLLPDRRHRRPVRLHRRAHLAGQRQPDQPGRHRSLRLP